MNLYTDLMILILFEVCEMCGGTSARNGVRKELLRLGGGGVLICLNKYKQSKLLDFFSAIFCCGD